MVVTSRKRREEVLILQRGLGIHFWALYCFSSGLYYCVVLYPPLCRSILSSFLTLDLDLDDLADHRLEAVFFVADFPEFD